MTISIRAIIHEYAETLVKTWAHDRNKTVGASEIGACIRKTYFSKHNAPRDPDYQDSWGARERGNLIENYFWLPAMRAGLPDGAQLLYAGDEQQTLSSGYLSATTDGLVIGLSRDALAWAGIDDIGPGRSVIVECKSTDPRATITQVTARSEHKFQVHVQLGLMREFAPETAPEYAIISYIDASFLDNVTEYPVRFDLRIYAAAHARAEKIMTARDALAMEPEGKMAGGAECQYCAWASHCAHVTVAGVPRTEHPLDNDAKDKLSLLVYKERSLATIRDSLDVEHAGYQEQIKEFLRSRQTRRAKGDGWSISYSRMPGKTTLDFPAIEAAGIDLSEFYKTGDPSERLMIMISKELLIEVRVPLPEGLFETADTITKVRVAATMFQAALESDIGDGFTFSVETVGRREKKARNEPNGAAEEATTARRSRKSAERQVVDPGAQ